MWAAYFINCKQLDVRLLIWCAVLLDFNLLLIVLNGLIVFTVLIIFIALICCLFSFLRSFLIALVASIVLNMLAVLIVLLVEDVFYLYACRYWCASCHCQRCHCPHVVYFAFTSHLLRIYFAFTCIFYMFAIKRVFAAPPGKTSGFADLFWLKRRPPRHDQRSEQCSTKIKILVW